MHRLLAITSLLLAGTAAGQTQYWVASGDGAYNDIANWSSAVPNANMDIILDQNLAYTISLPGGVTWRVDNLAVNDGDVTFDLGNTYYQVQGATVTPGLVVGQVAGQHGEITFVNGSFRMRSVTGGSSYSIIGHGPGASGTVNVTGSDTELCGQAIGYPCYASSPQFVGYLGGTGQVNVNNGAHHAASLHLGYGAGSTGTFTIEGSGSRYNGGLLVGTGTAAYGYGTGYVYARDGAVVGDPYDVYTRIGFGGTGHVEISGTGSHLYGSVVIDSPGTGSSLSVFDNATTDSLSVHVREDTTGVGNSVNLYDNGSLEFSRFHLEALGAVNIDSGGQLLGWLPQYGVYTGQNNWYGGINICDGGTLNLSGGLLKVNAVDMNFTLATPPYSNYYQRACTFGVGTPPVFNMTGGTLTVRQFFGDLTVLGGTVDPGDSVGTTAVGGEYVQSATTSLRINIDGATPDTEHDQVTVSGSATLDGKVEVILNPAFSVSAGQSFDILTADVISGGFSSIKYACISDTLHWTVSYDLDPAGIDTASLVVAQAPAGAVCNGAVSVVEVDVDPWSSANEVRPDSTDSIVVAIHGSNTATGDPVNFDVQQVDQSTLRFGPSGAAIISQAPLYGDYDADSNQDAAFVFTTPDTGIACDDTTATLTGETYAGELFEGTSPIVTADCDTNVCHP